MRLIFLVLSKRVIFSQFRVEFTQKKFYEIDSWCIALSTIKVIISLALIAPGSFTLRIFRQNCFVFVH